MQCSHTSDEKGSPRPKGRKLLLFSPKIVPEGCGAMLIGTIETINLMLRRLVYRADGCLKVQFP